VKSPIFYRKDEAFLLCRDSPNSKVVRHNMKACKNSGFGLFAGYQSFKKPNNSGRNELTKLVPFFSAQCVQLASKKTGTEI
jgi:hypothetical protein